MNINRECPGFDNLPDCKWSDSISPGSTMEAFKYSEDAKTKTN